MGRPALDQLPTDLLNEITLLIFRGPDRLKNLIKFSQTSKRVRSQCIPILFKDVGICGRGLPSPPLQECIELLNRVVSNPDIASAVQHFIAIPWEDYKPGISPRTLFLGVNIPAFLCSNAPETEADRKPFDLEGYMKGTEAEVTQSLMEMILAHTTNIRSIDSCSYNSSTAFDTLPTASTALHRPLLFPQLTKILHDDVVWQKVQHWAEWAPHLESLRLRRVCGPVNRAQFDNVIRLHLVDATFTGSEIKELMSGFPNVTNFSFSWPSEKTKQQCLPQDVVEALEPLCTKLRLLRLHMAQVRISHDEDSSNELFTQLGGVFPAWQIEKMMQWRHLNLGARTTKVSGLITSLKQFQVLEELRIDANVLFDTGLDESEDRYPMSRFGKLLPESLKRLGLGHFTKEFSHNDLRAFASEAEVYCPSLVSIGIEVADISQTYMSDKEWDKLHNLYLDKCNTLRNII